MVRRVQFVARLLLCKICVTHEMDVMGRLKGQPTARVFDVIKTGPTKTPDSLQPP
jgi:hypothetical protein